MLGVVRSEKNNTNKRNMFAKKHNAHASYRSLSLVGLARVSLPCMTSIAHQSLTVRRVPAAHAAVAIQAPPGSP